MTPPVRPRDVQVASIGSDTLVLRSRSWDRLKFEVEYARQRGTTANSYLIQAPTTALIDPPGSSFTDIFLDTLPDHHYLQRLEVIILSHVNPNRIATLKRLLALAPYAKVVCSRPGAIALRAALQGDPDIQSSREDEAAELGIDYLGGRHDLIVIPNEGSLDLGDGHELQFRFVPTPRHPDALCTYDPATGILYSDKLFGCHVCDEAVFDAQWRDLEADRRYYFDCLHGGQGSQIKTILDKLDPWPARTYAPAHGPIVRHSHSRLATHYREWCAAQQTGDLRVAILYTSAYGNTSRMAEQISQGLLQSGLAVDEIDCEQATPEHITQTLNRADGFIIGSPTLAGHAPIQIQTALGIVLSTVPSTKLAGVFGSYGWSGEAVDMIESKLRDAGHSLGFESLRVKFRPTPEFLETCRNAGSIFAQTLRKQTKVRPPRQTATTAPTDRTGQALERVIGSVCVVTLPTSPFGILTSSISQASFTPPGITLALPNLPELGSLAQPQATFWVNLLQDGDPLQRHRQPLLSPETLATATEEGGLVLTTALACLWCQVQSWIDAGDHRIFYATVQTGKVQHPGVTALRQARA